MALNRGKREEIRTNDILAEKLGLKEAVLVMDAIKAIVGGRNKENLMKKA